MNNNIPAIQSAVLNIGTAMSDCESAQEAWMDEKWNDATLWINNAIDQLESARAKITAHAESPSAVRSLVKLRSKLFGYIRKALEEDGHCKGYEGTFEIRMPSYFDHEWAIVLHCYVIGPRRRYKWHGRTLTEAVSKAEKEINSLLAEWDAERDQRKWDKTLK